MLGFIGKVLLIAWLIFELISLFIIIKGAFKLATSLTKSKPTKANVNPVKHYITQGASK